MNSKKSWTPDRRDLVRITDVANNGEPKIMLVLSPKEFNEKTGTLIALPVVTDHAQETNPFAIQITGPRGIVTFILAHQPVTSHWREYEVENLPFKQVPEDVFARACETLSQIIQIGE